ncbi:MAG: NAD(P)/FAD-dependent oxidoreductase [Halanaerobiaceae bacterium]
MHYVIIGAGVAGVSAVREIVKKRKSEDEITIITDESYPFYYRPRLIECLSGEVSVNDIIIHDENWFEENDVELKLSETVQEIDPVKKIIITDKGQYSYNKLLIANGAHCFMPPIKGNDKKNVFTLRDVDDVREIYGTAEDSGKAVVVGGGLLGLECAYNLMKSGLQVTVVEIMARLLPRQLDEEGATVLRSLLEDKGLKFYLDDSVEEFTGDEYLDGVKLASGESEEADLVLVSAGIRPNIGLVESLDGFDIDKGIKVNQRMETGLDGVYAAGDIAQFRDRIYGIWMPSQQQGKVAGLNMVGAKEEYEPGVTSHKLKVVGINVLSKGELDFESEYRIEVEADSEKYRKIVYDGEGNIIGAIVVGDFTEGNDLISTIK